MGLLQFLILFLVVLALTACAVWAAKRWIPDCPAWVGPLLWGLALFIIVVTLLTVTGILGVIGQYDPKIPKLG